MLSPKPLLYLVTDRLSLEGKNNSHLFVDLLTRAAKAGVDLIQIREKDMTGRELFELSTAAITAVRPLGAKVLVNDRIDVALAAGADGVHLPSNSIPVTVARELIGGQLLLGVSTHSFDQVKQAENAADFIVYGPIFPTLSKLKYGGPQGLESLGEITAATKLPVIAIGGITEANYDSVLRKGAAGIAAIGMFAKTDSLTELVGRIKSL
jgi:thiamine-phosphate pyrophosphorylase